MNKRSAAWWYGIALSTAMTLVGCGGGGGSSTPAAAPAAELDLTAKIGGKSVPIFSSAGGTMKNISVNAGQELEIDANTGVKWAIDPGDGNLLTGTGTLQVNGITVAQKTSTSTVWDVVASGTSAGSLASTQGFKLIATSIGDASKSMPVSITVNLGPASGGGGWAVTSDIGTARSVMLDPANTQTGYAQSVNGLYKTVNAGSTWTLINTQLTSIMIAAIAIDPTNSNVLYASADNSAPANGPRVMKSTDAGMTWSASDTGLPQSLFTGVNQVPTASFAINPLNSQTVYVATSAGVYKSANGGASWAATGLTGDVRAVVIDPTNPLVLYAGADTSTGLMNKTTDGGATWTQISAGLTLANPDAVTGLVIAKSNPQIVYMTTVDGFVYKTTDGGAHWTALTLPASSPSGASILALAVDPANPQTAYVSIIGARVFKTTDGGASWSEASLGLGSGVENVYSLAIDPAAPPVLYAATFFGVYKTLTGGQ